MNKKFIYKFFVLFALSFFFFGCQQNSEDNTAPNTYKIESGIVSNSVAYEAKYRAGAYGGDYDFKKVKAIRDYLYENTAPSEYKGIITGVSRSDVHNFLTTRGSSSSAADAQIAFIDSNGNNLAFFYVTNEDSKKAWIYAVKE